MSNFFVSLTNNEIARQIANLINRYNNLYIRHNWFTIISCTTDYFVEIVGDKVVGCAGIIKESDTWSIVKHICVAPEFRNRGIAAKLLKLAIQNCKTKHIYMTIRENNIASLSMANKLGFIIMRREWARDHYIVAVGRKVKYETNYNNSKEY